MSLLQFSQPAPRWRLWLAVCFVAASIPSLVIVELFSSFCCNLVQQYGIVAKFAVSGLSVSVVLTLAIALTAPRWRNGALGDTERALYWFGCALALFWVTGALSEATTLEFRHNAGKAARVREAISLFTFAAIPISAAVLTWPRWRAGTLGATGRGLYWFGCLLFLSWSVPPFFMDAGWSFWGPTGAAHVASGAVVSLAATLTAAIVFAGPRWWNGTDGGTELALYWLGCVWVLIDAIHRLSIHMDWRLVESGYFSPYLSGALVIIIFTATSAIALAGPRWRSGALGSTELTIYWLVVTFLISMFMLMLFRAWDWSFLGSKAPASFMSGVISGLSIFTCSSLALFVARKRLKAAHH